MPVLVPLVVPVVPIVLGPLAVVVVLVVVLLLLVLVLVLLLLRLLPLPVLPLPLTRRQLQRACRYWLDQRPRR